MFDPEKVERINADNEDRQEIVLASDYDQLLELYRKAQLEIENLQDSYDPRHDTSSCR